MFNSYFSVLSNLKSCNQELDLINKNINNANSESYIKRRLIHNANENIFISEDKKINNYSSVSVVREKNDILDAKIRIVEGIFNISNTQSNKIQEVKSIFNSSYGIDDKLNTLINTIGEIKKDPLDINYRKHAFNAIQDIISYFRYFNNKINELQENTMLEIKENISKVNNVIKDLFEINNKFSQEHDSTYNILNLQDKRDFLLQELSKFINFNVYINNNISTVLLNNGYLILDKDIHANIKIEKRKENKSFFYINYNKGGEAYLNEEYLSSYGIIGGLISFYKENLKEIKLNLNKIVFFYLKNLMI